MIIGHGDDIHAYGDKIKGNFSSNIYRPYENNGFQEFLSSKLNVIYSYSEPDAASLCRSLAHKYSVDTDCIAVTNGATEAIYLIAQAYRKSRTAIIIPTFSEYEDACSINEHELLFYRDLEEVDADTDMVWLCNPNNPDGKIYALDYLKDVVSNNEDTLFVFDQSYAAYTDQPVWDIRQAAGYKNMLLIHSMTKQYCIPGLRLGYITAHPSSIKRIKKYTMPWAVNAIAIEAGKYLIGHHTDNDLSHYKRDIGHLRSELNKIERLDVIPGQMNFFLCKLHDRRASDLKSWLMDNYGILIRDAANFRGLDETYFRIAAQSAPENELLVKAIREWMQK